MFDNDSEVEFSTISYEERLQLALKTGKKSNNAISRAKVADMYDVKKSILQNHIKGAISKAETGQKMQRLSPEEEEALASWILLLASWCWPVKIELRGMAYELLQAKDDIKELGMHWMDQFLKRYPHLKSKFVSRLEKDRVAAEDPIIIKNGFELVDYHIRENAVKKKRYL